MTVLTEWHIIMSHTCVNVFGLLVIHIGPNARVGDRTPMKAKWIKTLILQEISQTPNIANKHLKNILSGLQKVVHKIELTAVTRIFPYFL